ncbi:MAG: hypothetical protein HY048_07350 [Acidobacteria bacterium]|nr:hypothetical protein [Acidobacteriota bacterium]
MRRALLVLILALAVVPVANDACCNLDQPLASARTSAGDPSCPLHAGGGSGSTAPRPQPETPGRCTHDLSIDRAALVKTVVVAAPVLAAAIATAPSPARVAVFTSASPVAPPHTLPRRGSRPDVLRI